MFCCQNNVKATGWWIQWPLNPSQMAICGAGGTPVPHRRRISNAALGIQIIHS